ncbi:Cerevisin [Dactylellina cionopaga]|nr:Cerevisin [Dactylellina cionopaga]
MISFSLLPICLLYASIPVALAAPVSLKETVGSNIDKRQNGVSEEDNAPWNLRRISDPEPISSGFFGLFTNYIGYKYQYPTVSGTGVDLYVMDTGMQLDIPDIRGRANFVKGQGFNTMHGTEVAGIAGGTEFGVAKNVKIWYCSMANPTGCMSEIITRHNQRLKDPAYKGSVINMSFAAHFDNPSSYPLGGQIKTALAAGIHIVTAAGNDHSDSCGYYPGAFNQQEGAKAAINVGATNIKDSRATFSNYGNCIDIYAPGEDVFVTSPQGTAIKNSGTSFAAPMVAGMVATLLSSDSSLKANPTAMKQRILTMGIKDTVREPSGWIMKGNVITGAVLLQNGVKR